MKSCPKCKETFERDTEVCYYCGFSPDGEENVYSTPSPRKPANATPVAETKNVHSIKEARTRKKRKTSRLKLPKLEYQGSTIVIAVLSFIALLLIIQKATGS